MGPAQRTVLRVVVAGSLLVYLLYRFQQSGLFAKDNAMLLGILLMMMGALSFYFRAKFKRSVPDLQERLIPIWGYGLPQWGQMATSWLIIVLGVGLVAWAQFF
jgi:hypothetical protein